MTNFIIILALIGIVLYSIFVFKKKKKDVAMNKPFPEEWSAFLLKNVTFYRSLSAEKRLIFEHWVKLFLYEKDIFGAGVEVTDEDRLLVASSAIIPVFAFPYYTYPNLMEVLIYPEAFDSEYNIEGPNRSILGMVGRGLMEGKMILSKTALEHGFWNDNDKRNVGIHEFIHLMDKQDGAIDGVPALLLDNKLSIPWVELVKKETDQIFIGSSDIDSYAATNNEEFLAVIGEYFFESPEVLNKKHPELYKQLCTIFKQEPNLSGFKKGKF